MNVAHRITQLREDAGLSVNKLANLAGISQSHLRQIELGQRNPTVETLSYFCDVLNVSLSEFFSEENDGIDPVLKTALNKLNTEQQQKLAEFINSIGK